MNDKRISRLWRDEGLRVPYRKRNKPLRGIGVLIGQTCPIAPDVIWAAAWISKSEISSIYKELDKEMEGLQTRKLDHVDFPYYAMSPT